MIFFISLSIISGYKFFMHLKCPNGHLAEPCNPQGLQVKSGTSIILFFLFEGVKPSYFVVGPNIANMNGLSNEDAI